jgi:Rieske Fe-S protein
MATLTAPRRRRSADRWIEALIKGERLPEEVLNDPDEVAALRAAIALRAARPGADLPDESFLTELRRQLEDADQPADRSRIFSRRNLLAGAGVAAASAAAGVAGAVVDRELLQPSGGPARRGQVALQPDEGQWVTVANHSDLAGGAVKGFATPGVAGFVSEQNGELLAVSGVCTHLGCLLQANGAAGRLDCPCHRTAFSLKGQVVFSQLSSEPEPLPRLQVRRRDGAVEVFVPRLV